MQNVIIHILISTALLPETPVRSYNGHELGMHPIDLYVDLIC